MGDVKKTSSGRYQANACAADPSGEVHRKQRTFKTKREADDFVRDVERLMRAGKWPPAPVVKAPTLKALWEDYERLYMPNRLTGNSPRIYEISWRLDIEPCIGAKHIDKLTEDDVLELVDYCRNRGLGVKSINNTLVVLASMLSFAQGRRLITERPRIELLKVPQRPPEFLTLEEAERLIGGLTGQLRRMVLVALRTGMRRGELCGLQWDCVLMEQRQIVVRRSYGEDRILRDTKTKLWRSVPMMDDVIAELEDQRHDRGPYVFTRNDEGDPVNPNTAYKDLVRDSELVLGRAITWHPLRHTLATHLMYEGHDPRATQAVLGHTKIETTMIYSQIIDSKSVAAVNALEVAVKRTAASLQHGRNVAGERDED